MFPLLCHLPHLTRLYQLIAIHLRGLNVCLINNDRAERNGKQIRPPDLWRAEKKKTQCNLSQTLQKSKEMTAKCLFSVFDISVMSRIVESV